MPELPEVETTRAGLAPHLEGRRVRAVVLRRPDLRWPIPPEVPALLPGQRIQAVRRRAKYLLLDTAAGSALLHLGMSGSLRVLPASTYMNDYLPAAGVLTARAPDARELADIACGERAARAVGVADIGQTVVVRHGMVLAVEASSCRPKNEYRLGWEDCQRALGPCRWLCGVAGEPAHSEPEARLGWQGRRVHGIMTGGRTVSTPSAVSLRGDTRWTTSGSRWASRCWPAWRRGSAA